MASFPFIVDADELSNNFHDLEFPPKLSISHNKPGWPVYEVESVKYHLYRLSIKSPLATYLLKEKYKCELTDGIEGSRSITTLELWKLGPSSVEKKMWYISESADSWQFSSSEELVLTKYGCCDSPNIYKFYDIETGVLIRSTEGWQLPVNK